MQYDEEEIEEARQANAAASEILNTKTIEWVSRDKGTILTAGKPRGLISVTLARVLGPMQSSNMVLDRIYRALAGIRRAKRYPYGVEGQHDLSQPPTEEEFETPVSDLDFQYLFSLFEGDDDALNDYVGEWFQAFYPEMVEVFRQVVSAGGGPEAIEHATRGASKDATKKSRTPRSRSRSAS